MFLLKLFFLTSFLYTAYGSESSEELEALLSNQEGVDMLRNAIKFSYEKNKLDVISTSVAKGQEELENSTLVASQNIYGPNGEVVEVRTVELHIPQVANKSSGLSADSDKEEDDNDNDDGDKNKILSELRQAFDISSKIGLSMQMSFEEYTKDGKVVLSAYINKDLLYGYSEGIHLVHKSIEVNSTKEADDDIRKLQRKGVPVAVHKFDANGEFLSEKSNIEAEYTVSVINADGDVPQEFLDEAQSALAKTCLEFRNNQNEVPGKLAEYLSNKYPDYDFNIFLKEPKAWYVTKDYKIDLRYYFNYWDNSEDIVYSIFVLKKDVTPTTPK